MSTATTTTSHDTGQHASSRPTNQPATTNNPTTQTSPNAANRLRTTMAAVKLAFTWLGVRKTRFVAVTVAAVQQTVFLQEIVLGAADVGLFHGSV
jgi:hypothetical protein